jgi:hypothetical protein
MPDSQPSAPYALYKPRFLPGLLTAWLVSAAIYVWFSGASNAETLTGAAAYALGYTSVFVVFGFLVLRKAQNPTSLLKRSIVVALVLAALVANGIYEDKAELRTSVRNECEALTAENTDGEGSAYCDCFTEGATAIIQSASRRALFLQLQYDPMQDESYVNAMQEVANTCLNSSY